jgi:hypothetical protein
MCGFKSGSPCNRCILGMVSLGLGSIDIDQAVSTITHMTAAKAIVRMKLDLHGQSAPAGMDLTLGLPPGGERPHIRRRLSCRGCVEPEPGCIRRPATYVGVA